MSSVDDSLDEITRLRQSVKLPEAEEMYLALVSELGPDELRVCETDLRHCASKFLPKRKRKLLESLEAALQGVAEPPIEPANPDHAVSREMRQVLDELQESLALLSSRHIFQWNTYYRDTFTQFARQFIAATHEGRSSAPIPGMLVAELLDAHAYDIFTKGYLYTSRNGPRDWAIGKATSGIRRFLDIPLELYTTLLEQEPLAEESRVIRKLMSGVSSGILRGFSRCDFGNQTGGQVLIETPDAWVPILAFLTGNDTNVLLGRLPANPLRFRFEGCLAFTAGVDIFVNLAQSHVPLPTLVTYSRNGHVLDVSFGPTTGATARAGISAAIGVSAEPLGAATLQLARGNAVTCMVGHPSEEARAYLASEPYFDHLFVDAGRESDPASRVASVLELAAFRSTTGSKASQPIRQNYAKQFPIGNQFLTRLYRVDRTSVRDLLRTVERRNGVRLWCSVRRSGKTTAGLDLASTSPDLDLISQTCDDTGQNREEQVVYTRIIEAVERGRHLPATFLADVLEECSNPDSATVPRKVFVLDEYETLFGKLAAEAAADTRMRYSIAQPLLNQFVTFSRDNLVIFLGQQPTAHHILMDQNQLSPYIIQDKFPLFSHGSEGSEFGKLLEKILTSRLAFDHSFASRVFKETRGHPFMTVNMMVELVDWLIASGRRADRLHLTDADFDEFGSTHLTKSRLAEAPSYDFFRNGVAGQALSTLGRDSTPWLHAVYSSLRHMCLESASTLTFSRAEFTDAFYTLGLADLGYTPEYILTTAASANFLDYDGYAVSPAIPLLGRLSTVAPMKIGRF